MGNIWYHVQFIDVGEQDQAIGQTAGRRLWWRLPVWYYLRYSHVSELSGYSRSSIHIKSVLYYILHTLENAHWKPIEIHFVSAFACFIPGAGSMQNKCERWGITTTLPIGVFAVISISNTVKFVHNMFNTMQINKPLHHTDVNECITRRVSDLWNSKMCTRINNRIFNNSSQSDRSTNGNIYINITDITYSVINIIIIGSHTQSSLAQ